MLWTPIIAAYGWSITLVILKCGLQPPIVMPKISLDMPNELLEDLKVHVGDAKKFVSVADAVRTACRKMLDHLDEIDTRHGRIEGDN